MITFREKSLWVSLLVSAIIASIYGDNILHVLFSTPSVPPEEITRLITRLVIAFVIFEVVLHITLAMDDQEGADAREDEREKVYRLKANETGYWILSFGVITCLVQQMLNNVFNIDASGSWGTFALAPIEIKLVVVFWLSEVVRFVSELYYFRKESL